MLLTAVLTHGWTLRGFLLYAFFLGNFVDLTPYNIFLLGVLWSLAVEEHFYFVWPIAVRFLSRQHLILLSSFVVLVEPLIRYVATPHVASFFTIYELTPFRLDGLAAGALLALLVEREADRAWLRRFSPGLVLATLAALILLPLQFKHFIREDNRAIFNAFGYSLVIAFCFAFVAWIFLNERGVIARALAWRPLVLVGEISYGMYLYHRLVMSTLFKFLHVGYDPSHVNGLRKLLLLDFPLTVAFAYISFRFLERPLMERGRRLAGRNARSETEAVASVA